MDAAVYLERIIAVISLIIELVTSGHLEVHDHHLAHDIDAAGIHVRKGYPQPMIVDLFHLDGRWALAIAERGVEEYFLAVFPRHDGGRVGVDDVPGLGDQDERAPRHRARERDLRIVGQAEVTSRGRPYRQGV